MPEAHDIIVVGGGHNGMVAAFELARAGWSVLVLEAGEKVGGCATTTERLLAGFRHHPHANSFLFIDVMPDAITPATLGVGEHRPAAQLGVTFSDGRPPVILHRPDCLAQTSASLEVYSRADARTYVELKQSSAALDPLIRKGLYSAPDREWFASHAESVRNLFSSSCNTRSLGQNTARALIDELFAAPEVRVLFYHLATETGVGLEERGGDLAFLGYSVWLAGRWRIPVGGMQAYADALCATIVAAGVRVLRGTRVARIVVKDGRAIGVETTSGERLLASRGVLAAIPLLDIFDELVGADSVAQAELAELEGFRRSRARSVASTCFCLKTAPVYKSARHDPQIASCLKTVIGHESPADVLAHESDLEAHLLPKPAGVVRVPSLWDRTLAPIGHHVAGIDSSFPAADSIDRGTWQSVEASFPEALLDTWRRYCNGDLPISLAMTCDLSARFERRMLMRMGARQYRASISGLYLCGPGVYPGGGVHGACGQNAARTIMDDYRGAFEKT